MPKLPGISSDQAIRVFCKIGFKVIRQGKHTIMSDGQTRLVIPHSVSIHAYTMGAIAQDAGLTPKEFKDLI